MKASELIEKLKVLIESNGDLNVTYYESYDGWPQRTEALAINKTANNEKVICLGGYEN